MNQNIQSVLRITLIISGMMLLFLFPVCADVIGTEIEEGIVEIPAELITDGESAADGDNSTDAKESGLAFDYASVTNGETEVEIDRPLLFVFDSNVNNITTKENNARCFTITDETGINVPFDVILFDDQLERDLRRDIQLEIHGGMEEGKTYTVTISKDLMAKNGATLDEDIEITFSTTSSENEA
jgi:hypothetical protein